MINQPQQLYMNKYKHLTLYVPVINHLGMIRCNNLSRLNQYTDPDPETLVDAIAIKPLQKIVLLAEHALRGETVINRHKIDLDRTIDPDRPQMSDVLIESYLLAAKFIITEISSPVHHPGYAIKTTQFEHAENIVKEWRKNGKIAGWKILVGSKIGWVAAAELRYLKKVEV